jgi:ribonuclease HI
MAKKHYVVWVGNNTGVFDNWAETQKATSGAKGAKFKSFPNITEANKAFTESYELHYGNSDGEKSTSGKIKVKITKKLDLKAYLTVDAAYNGKESEWRGVMCGTDFPHEPEIFRSPVHSGGSNNIGEFLALIEGICYLLKSNQLHIPIYSDSKTALAWHRNKEHKSTVIDNKINDPVMMNKFFKSFDFLNGKAKELNYILEKWHTKEWGEIAADFGRK